MSRWTVASAITAVALLLAVVSGQQLVKVGSFVEGEILVKFADASTAPERNVALASRSASRIRRFDALGVDLVRIAPGQSVDDAVKAFQAIPGVLAQPNYRRHTLYAGPPNDPYWLDSNLWGMNKISAKQVWTTFTAGDGSVVIADIDTGIRYDHPDLALNIWNNPFEVAGNGLDDDNNGYIDDVHGIDTANQDGDPYDDQGHGTHTSGTVAARGNNGIGVAGVNWNAKLLSCKFLDASGFGSDAGAIECFNYVVSMRLRGENIRVTSNSWGALRDGPIATVLLDAINAAGTVGIINIFGAGNDGQNNDTQPFDPASYPADSIVSVASSGPTDRRSSFSNYGATSVDLAAPGENIVSTYIGTDYSFSSGTSMAAPHVAGVAALLAKMQPGMSVATIKQLLIANVDKSSRWNGLVVSGGRLNAFKAASAVSGAGSNTPPSVTITAPTEGQQFSVPATITVSADASDSDGTIASVSFFANGAPIGAASSAPYTITWQPPMGNYTLTAVATDDDGAITPSVGVHVLVINIPPIVSLTAPSAGSTFTVPVDITMDATASDPDGAIASVTFLANGTPIGTDTSDPFSISWYAAMGSYTLTAVATDNGGAATTSAPVPITVNPLPGRTNLALAGNGGAATASSMLNANYPPSGAVNGDRKGLGWGAGGGWNDGTQNASPDWLEVNFTGLKLIEEVNVFSMQDNYSSPAEPTPTMTFVYWGLSGFQVQYWDGAAWLPVPNGVVANNNLVWRQFVFAPIVTQKVRVHVTAPLNGYSRVMEVEAFGIASGVNAPPSVAVASPTEGATFTAPATITVTANASDSDGSVASVTFFADGAPIGTDTTSPYSVSWADVPAGAYTLTAAATDNQDATTTSAPVHVFVANNSVPSVSITSPAEGASFVAPATVVINASASDSDGSITSVAFFANGVPLGSDSTAPYSVAWPNVQAGTYVLTAVATDNLGAPTTSAPVEVVVIAIPGRMNVALASNGGVASASSVLGANYPPSGAINDDRKGLGWGAGGGWNDGTSNASPDWLQVDFAGLKQINEINVFSMQDNYGSPAEPTPTMTFVYWGLAGFQVQYWNGGSWVTVPGGTVTNNNLVWRQFMFEPVVTQKIRVFITAPLNGYSRVMELEAWGAAAEGNAPPSVTLTSPAEGAGFTAPAPVTVSATATDSDGTIASVAFFANGAPIGTDTTSPYSVTWTAESAGAVTLTAVATDNQDGTTTSAPVHVTIAPPNVLPSVSVTSPAEGALFTAPATVTISAAASDSDGTIASVAFFANGTAIGSDSSVPYSVTWFPTMGNYTLTAIAIDNRGGTTTSAAVHVTVQADPSRANVALAVNGGVATASSQLGVNYPPSGAINGDRRGLMWGLGGGWNDATQNASPDWLEVTFNGPKTIDEINVFSMQDAYQSPVEPTASMTFVYWGLAGFQVQYWDGTAWVTVPSGTVSNNNLVWRRFVFAPVTTTKIRVLVTAPLNGYSRMMELEAWGVAAPSGRPQQ